MRSPPIDLSPKGAGIVGVSGYSGMELARILASHPHFSLGLVTSDKWAGKRLGNHIAVAARVVDLSGGFRLAADQFPQWYGFTHPAPALLAEAVYSLPEAGNNAEKLRTARLGSNPGCYPTAA